MNKTIKKAQLMVLGKASKLTLGTKYGRHQEYNKPGYVPFIPKSE